MSKRHPMPTGPVGQTVTIGKRDGCRRCDLPYWMHGRKRVYHSNGTYSYDYECPDVGDVL